MSNDRSLRLEVVLSAIDKITAPARKMSQAIGATAKAIKESSDRIKELNRSVENIDAFKKLDKEVSIAANAFKGAQTRIAALKAEMAAAPQAASLSWREFNAQRMSEYMRTEGGHAGAMKRMAAEWKKYKETAAPSAGAVSAKTEELARAIREATKESDALKARHGTLLAAQQKLFGEMKQGGIDMHNLAGEHKRLAGAIDVENAARGRLGQTIAAQKRELQQLRKIQEQYRETISTRDKLAGAGTSMVVGGAAMTGALAVPVAAYAQAEDASTRLRVSMMRAGGVVSEEYARINELAMRLGDRLPGTTADFQNMMTMLIRQGMAPKAILGGLGEATAYLGVQLKLSSEESAEFAAKLQDATRTAEGDMMGLMDTIQRTFYVGVDPTNMLAGFAKLSPALDTIRMKGLAGAKALAPLLAMADQSGMDGSAAGNALRKVLQKSLNKTAITDTLGTLKFDTGIALNLDFSDGKGEFGGLDRMMEEMAKLRVLNTQSRLDVIKGIYGDDAEVMQVVSLLIEKGKDGYEDMQRKMADQSDIQRRVNEQLGTLKNLWEAATGTFTNAFAAIGETIAPELKALTQWLGEAASAVRQWAQEHPVLAGFIMKAIGVIAILTTVLGGLLLAVSAIFGPFALARYGMALFSMTGGGLISTLLNLGKSALPLVGNAIMWVGRAMLMNPIGLAVTAIGVAALLIYKYWEPIKEFFAGLWSQIKTAFDGGIGGIAALIVNWSPLGLFYKAFAAVLNWFGVELPGNFTEYGRMLIDGLVNGITGALGRARDAIGNVGDSVISWFKEKLGINSPSRVFAELGGFTMDGLAQGLQNSAAAPLQFVERMARQIAAAAGMGLAGAGASAGDLPDVPALPPIVQAIRYAPGEFPAPAALPAPDAAARAVRFDVGDIPNLAREIRIDNRPPIGAAQVSSAGAVTQHNEIHIHAAPGMDPQAIALAVSAELDRRERAKAVRSRSSLSDRY